MVNVEGCGYCKECVRMRVTKAMGRAPESGVECAYKHILDSYDVCANIQVDKTSETSSLNSTPSPDGSCASNCRWTSSGTNSRPSYDDMNFSDDYGCTPHVYRKRIKFMKRKKT